MRVLALIAFLTATSVAASPNEIQQCWNVGTVSSRALETSVTLAASFDASGAVIPSSIDLKGFLGRDEDAADEAFNAAKRALLRCGRHLPHWQNQSVTLRFDLRSMSVTLEPPSTT